MSVADHQETFRFLNQGHSPDIVRVSDLDLFAETLSAFWTLGFAQDEVNLIGNRLLDDFNKNRSKFQITEVIKILAAILHLGNVNFSDKYKKNSQEIDQEECELSVSFISDFRIKIQTVKRIP